MSRLHVLLGGLTIAALSLFVVSCGDSDDGEEAGTTSSETSATSSSSATTGTTSSSSSDTSETSASTESSVSTNELADGSGCTPPSDNDLPDGRWYGLIDVAGDAQLDFDLACFFTGDAATAAADDDEESPPPNDYYVRNASDLLRTLEVQTESPVTWYPDGGSPTDVVTVAYNQWLTDRESRDFDLAVWLTISTGTIVEIEEQWVP